MKGTSPVPNLRKEYPSNRFYQVILISPIKLYREHYSVQYKLSEMTVKKKLKHDLILQLISCLPESCKAASKGIVLSPKGRLNVTFEIPEESTLVNITKFVHTLTVLQNHCIRGKLFILNLALVKFRS